MPFITKLGSVAARAYGWLATTVSAVTSDAYFYLVSMLLSTTSTNGAQNNTFLDSSVNNFTITRNGNTTQGTFTPFSNTGWSYYFDGTGDYLTLAGSTAFILPTTTTPFTVEFWINPKASGGGILAEEYTGSTNPVSIAIWLGPSGQTTPASTGLRPSIGYFTGASWSSIVYTNADLSLNTWSHVAIVYTGSATKIYVNGVDQSVGTLTTWNTSANNQFFIGKRWDASATEFITGSLSNFRWVIGTAVYTANFTPSTEPLSPIGKTLLLTCQSNRFADASPNNFTITRNGDARVTANGPFAPSSTTPTSYSGWFDGTGDYLTTPSSAQLSFGTGDFTIEYWAWPSSGANNGMFQQSDTAGGLKASATNSVACNIFTTNSITVYAANTTRTTSTNKLPYSAWTHLAIVRASGVTKLYINGTLETSIGTSGSITDTTNYTGTYVAVGGYYSTAYLWNGAISNFRVVKGTAVYTTNFTPPTAPLTAITNTSLLTCQSTTFIDNSTNAFAITVNGNAQPITANPFGATTTQPVSYTASPTPTSYSGVFDGTGDYLTVADNTALDMEASNFTIECWIYPTITIVGGQYAGIFAKRPTSADFGGVLLMFNQSMAPRLYVTVTGSSWGLDATSPTVCVANTWTHLAVVRNGTNFQLYINGTSVISQTLSGTIPNNTNAFGIGTTAANGSEPFTGAISNFRVVKGTAVYTANFTPPTTPLTAISNTSLLTCQNTTFIDNSPNAFTITANGNAQTNANNPFGFTGTNVDGGAGYFDGNGDYLTVANNAAFNLGTTFTIDFWVYRTATLAQRVVSRQDSTSPYNGFSISYGESAGNYLFDANGAQIIVADTNINAWVHFAWVVNGTSGAVYRNGARVGTATQTAGTPTTNTTLLVGARPTTNFWSGYLSNFRIVKGVAVYSAAFVPPAAPTTAISGTSLLLDFTNAGIYDSAQQSALETVGNAQVSTTQAKWGATSMSFDGTGDWLLIPDNPNQRFGTGNFTIELWLYLNATGAARGLVAKGTGTTGWLVSLNASNQVVFTYTTSTITSTGTISANTWTYIAVVREGTGTNQTKIYINGTNDGTGTVATDFTQTNAMYVGADRTGGSALNGYIDDLRITNFARTISTPTTAFPTQ